MRCDNCHSEAISTTQDGGFGHRRHCLACGAVWDASPGTADGLVGSETPTPPEASAPPATPTPEHPE